MRVIRYGDKNSEKVKPGYYKHATTYEAIHSGIYAFRLTQREALGTCFHGAGILECKRCACEKGGDCSRYFVIDGYGQKSSKWGDFVEEVVEEETDEYDAD